MDVELAHRLSLIQRNLEAAQTSIDSAAELMSIVISELQAVETTRTVLPAGSVVESTSNMPKASGKRGRPKAKKAAPTEEKRAIGTSIGVVGTVREYVSHHNGVFTVDQLQEWIQEKGFAFNRKQLLDAVGNLVYSKELTREGRGMLKRVA